MSESSSLEQKLDTTTIRIETDTGLERASLTVYRAVSSKHKYTGLSNASNLSENTGMLFIYERSDTRTFVMRDMSFPLDILFFGSSGRLRKIYEAPLSSNERTQFYRETARWVLETNYHWSRQHNVTPGDRLVIGQGQ
ncbi:MAG: DUF192 domain-containing protein [bacterium]